MATNKPKHILIAPLDWGLGHTSRCIPIIRYIQSLGHIPVFAGNASQRSFIEETFGDIDIIHLEGYNVRYSGWNRLAQVGILSQLPGLLKTIKAEHEWLMQLASARRIDGIISDNRYGLFHPTIPCVILTHQLQVITGLGNFSDRVIRRMHYRYLDRFHATWVVDAPGTPCLGGKLSHPQTLPERARYIGLLSQFDDVGTTLSPKEDSLLILLSGPEPQRSVLSRILWQQVQHYKGAVTFVEGSEHAPTPDSIPPHITYYKRLTGKDLLPLLQSAGMVICRSGYSTLMDLAALHKKAILIPTPGQTEQEYLGHRLHEQGVFYCMKQSWFDLNKALAEACAFPFRAVGLAGAFDGGRKVVGEWVERV